MATSLWLGRPSFGQITIFDDHQVNDPNGPNGTPGDEDDDNPFTGTYKAQFEPWIAAHPLLPGIVFGAWNDYTNGQNDRSDGFGTTNLAVSEPPPWSDELVSQIEPIGQWLAAEYDPGCAIGGNGMFYQCGIESLAGNPVYFARSATGSGTTGWAVAHIPDNVIEPPDAVGRDTPRMSADWSTEDHRKNRVYLHWTRQSYNWQIVASQDPNLGEGWLTDPNHPQYVIGEGVGQFVAQAPVSAIGPNGQLYIAWIAHLDDLNRANILVNSTANPFPAGWPGVLPERFTATPRANFDSIGYGPTVDRTNLDVLLSWPAIAVDTSGYSSGNVYVAWVEEDTDPNTPNFVYVSVSEDEGHTWGLPVRVNWDAPGSSLQWMPSIAVDVKGRVGVMWHDTRAWQPPEFFRSPYDVYFAYSLDGGQTWSTNHRVTEQDSDPRSPGNPDIRIGEYNAMAASGESFYLIWQDLRRWNPNEAEASQAGDIFATRIDVTAGADVDGDGDVDLAGDYPVFQSCFSGPNNRFRAGCGNADFDADGDVDLSDFLLFEKLLSGDGNRARVGVGNAEPFTDDGGNTWYTRADVREGLRTYCVRNGILFR